MRKLVLEDGHLLSGAFEKLYQCKANKQTKTHYSFTVKPKCQKVCFKAMTWKEKVLLQPCSDWVSVVWEGGVIVCYPSGLIWILNVSIFNELRVYSFGKITLYYTFYQRTCRNNPRCCVLSELTYWEGEKKKKERKRFLGIFLPYNDALWPKQNNAE